MEKVQGLDVLRHIWGDVGTAMRRTALLSPLLSS